MIASDMYDVAVTRSLSEVDEGVEGTIYLFTERKPCPSFEGVIEKFKEMFPNIKLYVIYQYN
ncbi:MAG: deaminase domain-containing protein [Lachnospiraceae bacterium]